MSSSDESEMSSAKKTFLGVINFLSKVPKPDFNDVSRFYENSYDFARLSYLYSEESQLSDQEKEEFKNHFPTAFGKALPFTRGLYHNMSPDCLNEMRWWKSKVEFVQNDILNLYNGIAKDQISNEIEKYKKDLQKEEYIIEDYLESWTGPNGEGKDDPDDVPNLNGVPESHHWWSKEHRDLWKNKN